MDNHTLGQVRFVETLAMHAWPAGEMTLLDGWRLRFSQGVTRRANSVWPNQADGELALDDKLATICPLPSSTTRVRSTPGLCTGINWTGSLSCDRFQLTRRS